jgi:cold shock CspA family protein
MRGVVKTFRPEQGYGFIWPAGGDGFERVFLHASEAYNAPQIGDVVEFEPAPGRDGRDRAKAVRLVQRK